MRFLVTGATGFIGRCLLERMERPFVLSRDAGRAKRQLGERATPFEWRPPSLVPKEAFTGVDAVIHLAGESVAGRWTEAKKRRIRDSRIEGTRALVESMRSLESRPQVLVSASAVGYYGDRGDEILTEVSRPGQDFLAKVCEDWESEARRAEELGMRVVMLRTGIVLGKNGGALAKMLPPFKLGLGGRLGNGQSWMPWMHLEDLVGLYLHAAEKGSVSGAMNGSSPSPVRNAEFTKTLAKELHRPAIFPVPALGLRVLFGEFGEHLLDSQRVLPTVADDTGYAFRYPSLDAALHEILH